MTQKNAKLISRIFEPIFVAILGFVVIITNLDSTIKSLLINTSLLVIVPGIIYIHIVLKNKDIELKKRKSRDKLYLLISPLILIAAIFNYISNFDFFKILLVVGLCFLSALFINKKLAKISIHVMAITIFGLIYSYYSPSSYSFFYFLPIIYVVALARYTIKNHTIPELIVGFIVPILVSIILLGVFRGIGF